MEFVAFNTAESFYRGIGYPHAAVIKRFDVLAHQKSGLRFSRQAVEGGEVDRRPRAASLARGLFRHVDGEDVAFQRGIAREAPMQRRRGGRGRPATGREAF